jgi:E3 ubiquitin-protein ligase HUWE1
MAFAQYQFRFVSNTFDSSPSLHSIDHIDEDVPFEAPSRINDILRALGTAFHHGFFPTLLRSCISALNEPPAAAVIAFPEEFSTVIFSVLQLFVSYQTGCSALVDAGLIDSLLKLLKLSPKLKFVTRAVRILDHLFGFFRPSRVTLGELSVLDVFVQRLGAETAACTADGLPTLIGQLRLSSPHADASTSSTSEAPGRTGQMDTSADTTDSTVAPVRSPPVPAVCPPERKSLIKGILRYLINIASDPSLMTNVRNVVEGPFLSIVERIIRNPVYYGTSVWTLVCKWVTNFLNAEPNMLSALQESGISDAFLDVIAFKTPASSEILADLPNLLASLCFNERGLADFNRADPIGHLIPLFLQPEYLPSLTGDTATQLGGAMEELFRHQPSLRKAGVVSVVKLLSSLIELGDDPSISVVIGLPVAFSFF